MNKGHPHPQLNNIRLVMMMEKSEFERKINSLVPCPDQETTADLFALGQELGEESEYGSTQDILNSLSFISRHFDQEITQGVYEIIQYGSALPDEMVAAAVHMASRDCSPRQMAQAATNGELMCFHTPKDAEELSPLAVCTVCENGKSLTRYTRHFGGFDPKTALRSAQKCAHDRKITVTDALLSLTVDLKLNPTGGARKILARGDKAMTEMLDSCFDRYPVLAARLTFDTDRSQTAVEYNPLWLELHHQQEQLKTGTAPGMQLETIEESLTDRRDKMLEQRITEWAHKVLAAHEAGGMIDTVQIIEDIDRIIAEEFDHDPVLEESSCQQAEGLSM